MSLIRIKSKNRHIFIYKIRQVEYDFNLAVNILRPV